MIDKTLDEALQNEAKISVVYPSTTITLDKDGNRSLMVLGTGERLPDDAPMTVGLFLSLVDFSE